MKHFRLFIISLLAFAGTISANAEIKAFGDATQTSWAMTSADGCNMGSTVTLDGVVITLGSADDAGSNWTWNSKNAGCVPSTMPSVDGTAATLITSFSEEALYGNMPKYGAFFKIEPNKTGAITINALASANAAQPLIFVTTAKGDASDIKAAKITAWVNGVTSWTYYVDTEHDYYFFQQSYPDKLTAYRTTLRGFSFEAKAINTLAAGKYEISATITPNGGVTTPDALQKYINGYVAQGDLTGDAGELVISTDEEGFVLNGFSIVGDAVVLNASAEVVFGSMRFQLGDALGNTEGTLAITKTGENEYTLANGTIVYMGAVVGTVTGITFKMIEDPATGISEKSISSSKTVKVLQNGNIVILKNGVKYGVAGF